MPSPTLKLRSHLPLQKQVVEWLQAIVLQVEEVAAGEEQLLPAMAAQLAVEVQLVALMSLEAMRVVAVALGLVMEEEE